MRSKVEDWQYGEVDPGNTNSSHAQALELVGHNKKVLELGCTAGHMTRALSDRGCQVTGIEIDSRAAAIARETAQKVIVADLEDLEWVNELQEGHFDVVLAGDVLEHLSDPLSVLRASRPLLKPDGTLVVSLPNIAHGDVRLALLEGRFDYGPSGLLDDSHLRFFTVASSKDLLRKAGFIPLEFRRVVMRLFDSELNVDPQRVNEAVLQTIRADPEAETYQMVFKASLDNGDTAVRQLAATRLNLEEALQLERSANSALKAQLENVLATMTSERRRADEAERRADLLQESTIWKSTSPIRRLITALRGRTGHEKS